MVGARGMRAEVTMPLTHLCPFRDEVDNGTATLRWLVDERTLELHSVRRWLDSFARVVASHESVTGTLHDTLSQLNLPGVSVTTRWETAGGAVVIEA